MSRSRDCSLCWSQRSCPGLPALPSSRAAESRWPAAWLTGLPKTVLRAICCRCGPQSSIPTPPPALYLLRVSVSIHVIQCSANCGPARSGWGGQLLVRTWAEDRLPLAVAVATLVRAPEVLELGSQQGGPRNKTSSSHSKLWFFLDVICDVKALLQRV